MKQTLSPGAVAEAFADVLAGATASVQPRAVAACVRFLTRQRLLHDSGRILERLDELLLAREGYRRAAVVSATPLSLSETEEVERVLTAVIGAPVRARVSVRPSLIAGFRADVGGTLVDANVRGRFSRLRAHLRRHG